MPIKHLTKTEVEKLEYPAHGRVDYFDDKLKGFGVRVSAKRKTYFVLRRVNGLRERTTIDTADKVTAEKARKRAEGLLADMGRGISLNEEKREKRRQAEDEHRKGITLQVALDQYLNKGKLKPRTLTTCSNLFRLYLSDWLSNPAAEITRDMVKDRHRVIAAGKRQRRKLAKDGSAQPVVISQRREASADNCMRVLRTVLNYNFEDEVGGSPYLNPVSVLSSKRHKAWFQVERRKTLIKNSDLPAWYRAVVALDNSIMRDYLLFLLFTGLRRQEAATLKWKQVDFREGCFTIVDTKNGDPHTLPLSDFISRLLLDRKEGLKVELTEAKAGVAGIDKMTLRDQQTARNRVALAESRLASQYVFTGEGKTGYIVEPKRAIDAVTSVTGITFACHDLRRTFATLAESLDLSGYTIKALLNHRQQLSDVTGGYIIMNVDRLREPMQKITSAILERVKKQYGQVVQFQTAVV